MTPRSSVRDLVAHYRGLSRRRIEVETDNQITTRSRHVGINPAKWDTQAALHAFAYSRWEDADRHQRGWLSRLRNQRIQ